MGEVLDWFRFKGMKSTDNGVYAEELPPITIAGERVKNETVLGRSGSLTMLEGDAVFDDIELPIGCRVQGIDKLNSMTAWLFGSGRLELPNRPGGYYNARVSNAMELERVIRSRENRRFTVNFRAEPYFYLDDSGSIEFSGSSCAITNPGNAESEPRITVYGRGDVALAIGGQQMLLIGLEGGIILDTVLQDALTLDETQLMNNNAGGDFLKIPVGMSTMEWFSFGDNDNPGTISKIVITPRWRCR